MLKLGDSLVVGRGVVGVRGVHAQQSMNMTNRKKEKKHQTRPQSRLSCSADDPKWFGFAVRLQHFHRLRI